jgi:peptidoglycan/LPS O-acetylase OafA/YrhL
MLVFAEHRSIAGQDIAESIFNITNVGRVGVILFFITSGFVIPWSINSSFKNPIKVFIIGRFFRLYPAYWLSMLAAITIGALGSQIESTPQVAANILMFHKYLGIENLLKLYWTLQLELIFYLICSILCLLKVLNNKYTAPVLCVFFALVALAASLIRFHFSIKIPIVFPLGLSCMFVGTVIKSYVLDNDKGALKYLLSMLAVLTFVIPTACYFYFGESWYQFASAYLVAFALFYVLSTKIRLTSRFFVFTGAISYSVYLIHQVVLKVYYETIGISLQENYGLLFSFVFCSVFIILAASFAYYLVEKPSIALGRKMSLKYR